MGIMEKIGLKKTKINPEQKVSYPDTPAIQKAGREAFPEQSGEYEIVTEQPAVRQIGRARVTQEVQRASSTVGRVIERAREHKYKKYGDAAPSMYREGGATWKNALFNKPILDNRAIHGQPKGAIKYRPIPDLQPVYESKARMAAFSDANNGRISLGRAAMMQSQQHIPVTRRINLGDTGRMSPSKAAMLSATNRPSRSLQYMNVNKGGIVRKKMKWFER